MQSKTTDHAYRTACNGASTVPQLCAPTGPQILGTCARSDQHLSAPVQTETSPSRNFVAYIYPRTNRVNGQLASSIPRLTPLSVVGYYTGYVKRPALLRKIGPRTQSAIIWVRTRLHGSRLTFLRLCVLD